MHRVPLAALALLPLLAACGGQAPQPQAGPSSPPASSPVATSTSAAATASSTPGTDGTASPTTGATGSSAATTPTAGAATPTRRTVVIRVQGRTVRPAPGRIPVKVGERIDLVVLADTASAVHVHSDPEIEVRTTPGKPVVIEFTGSRKGSYEVELHRPSLLLTRLVVS
ncbi:MAG: hypothetical protein U0Q15_17660 [Kineosporiaceae bacterium]